MEELGEDQRSWKTEEDVDTGRIDLIAELLREHPLLPPRPGNAEQSYTEVNSGVCFPILHCAFRGCSWSVREEPNPYSHVDKTVENHVRESHFAAMQLPQSCSGDLMAYYCGAIAQKEQEGMPIIGPSVDRRTFKLLHQVYNSATVGSLVCFVCAQIHTRLECHANANKNINYYDARVFSSLAERNPAAVDLNLGLGTFLRSYAADRENGRGPFAQSPEFETGCKEWTLNFQRGRGAPDIRMLCCPEDVLHCGGEHGEEVPSMVSVLWEPFHVAQCAS